MLYLHISSDPFFFFMLSLLFPELSVEKGKIAHHKVVGLYLLMKLMLTKLFSFSLTQSGKTAMSCELISCESM